jgi:predicted phage replisome organizer
MLLKALKDDGYLYFDSLMSSFAEELALDIDEKPDDVKVTIQLLTSLGLMEASEDTDIYKLTYMDVMTGSETAHTQRQRDYIRRKKEREASLNDGSVTPLLHIGDVEKEIEKEKEIDIESREKRKRFVPPTLEDIKAYCQERNNNVDPKKFFDYYEQGGWKDSKGNPVKNWKQKLITWENKEPKKKHFGNERTTIDFEALKKRMVVN